MSVESKAGDAPSRGEYLKHRIKTPGAQRNIAAHAEALLNTLRLAPTENIRQKRENELAAAGIDTLGYTDDPACANHDRLLAALGEISDETWNAPLGELVVQDYCPIDPIALDQK